MAEDVIIDRLDPQKPVHPQIPDAALAVKSLTKGVSQMEMTKKDSKLILKGETAPDQNSGSRTFSSRELHDRSHYSTHSRLPASKNMHDNLDHTMLNRALAGYLFDCQLNKKITADDQWLEGLWEWVTGLSQCPFIPNALCLPVKGLRNLPSTMGWLPPQLTLVIWEYIQFGQIISVR
jgi:hypothetical protein